MLTALSAPAVPSLPNCPAPPAQPANPEDRDFSSLLDEPVDAPPTSSSPPPPAPAPSSTPPARLSPSPLLPRRTFLTPPAVPPDLPSAEPPTTDPLPPLPSELPPEESAATPAETIATPGLTAQHLYPLDGLWPGPAPAAPSATPTHPTPATQAYPENNYHPTSVGGVAVRVSEPAPPAPIPAHALAPVSYQYCDYTSGSACAAETHPFPVRETAVSSRADTRSGPPPPADAAPRPALGAPGVNTPAPAGLPPPPAPHQLRTGPAADEPLSPSLGTPSRISTTANPPTPSAPDSSPAPNPTPNTASATPHPANSISFLNTQPALFSRPPESSAGTPVEAAHSKNKNNIHYSDIELFVDSKTKHGTTTAYDHASMPATLHIVSSDFAATTAATPLAPITATPSPAAEALAIKLVERIAEISDQVSSRPAEEIKIELDLPDTRIEIRLALREGRLHANFRTDSADLREALARAWQDFAVASESTSTRWAEPTFSPSASAPSATNASPAHQPGGQAGLTDHREPRREAPPSPNTLPNATRSRSHTSTAVAASTHRPDASRLLSAVA